MTANERMKELERKIAERILTQVIGNPLPDSPPPKSPADPQKETLFRRIFG